MLLKARMDPASANRWRQIREVIRKAAYRPPVPEYPGQHDRARNKAYYR